jgi:hypothetical protein
VPTFVLSASAPSITAILPVIVRRSVTIMNMIVLARVLGLAR